MMNINTSSGNGFSIGLFIFKCAIWGLISTFLLLFLPPNVLGQLYLDSLVLQYTRSIGLVFFISATYTACYLLNVILDEVASIFLIKRKAKAIKVKLKLLDLAERSLLREFFLRGVTNLTLPVDQDVVIHLEAAHILERVNSQVKSESGDVKNASFKITAFARKHLNRQVLGLPNGNLTPRDIQRLNNTRPQYIHRLKRTRDYAA